MSRVNKPRKKGSGAPRSRLGTLLEASHRFKQTLKRVSENPNRKKSEKRIDLVLVHPRNRDDEKEDAEEKRERLRRNILRDCFEKRLKQEQFKIKEKQHGNNVYKMLHCSFERLCKEAEIVNLEMRLDSKCTAQTLRNILMKEKAKRMSAKQQYTGADPPPASTNSKQPWKLKREAKPETRNDNPPEGQCCGSFRGWLRQKEKDFFDPDPEDIEDFESTPFIMDRYHIYKGHEEPNTFFRPSVRSLLVKHILINLDIRTDLEAMDFQLKDSKGPTRQCCVCLDDDDDDDEDDEEEKKLQKIALPYLRMKEVYTDSLILHDVSKCSIKYEDAESRMKKEHKKELNQNFNIQDDPREDLDKRWTSLYKYQPLMKIRNYFGEKIAFYFAWSGLLITSLWVPMLLGFAIFLYGLYLSITGKSTTLPYQSSTTTTLAPNTTAAPEDVSSLAGLALEIIKSSFDNEVTPYFALIICIWGTLFLELWKQKCARCAYLWDVQEYEANEPDRPEFFSTTFKEDPVTKAKEMYFPTKKQNIRYLTSFSTLMFMILIVLTSVVSIIIYRVITSVDYCPNMDPTSCLLATTVVSSVLNTVSILILGKVYDYLAVKLTDWENHRTQTMYDDALIIKLFAFQFANNYASSFYIAFFRGRFDYAGILGLGSEYRDSCEGTCMSQLSFQILTNMLLKPLPKVFSDIVKPLLIRMWRKRPSCMQGEKPELTEDLDIELRALHYPETLQFMDKEYMKPTLGDFTVGEYTEKIIQYGFLMLFAASLPLAPLIALLTLLIDIRVDAKRMLWWYRRPTATVAQDIGTWFTILQIVNVCGVVSNGFIIAFTSSWGQQYDIVTQLWIVIGFEHIVFTIKFLLAYFIPDIPDDVALMMRKHQHWRTHKLAQILEEDKDQEKETLQETLLQNIIRSAELTELIGLEVYSEEDYRRRQSHGGGGGLGGSGLGDGGTAEPTAHREEEPKKKKSKPEPENSVPTHHTLNDQTPVEDPEYPPFRGGPDPLTPPMSEVRSKHTADHGIEYDDDDDNHVRKMKKKKKKNDKRRKQYGEDQLIIDCDEYELEDQGVRSRRRVAPLTPPPYDAAPAHQKLPGQLSFRVKGPTGEDLGEYVPASGRRHRHHHDDSVA
ncbi:anoctamin-4-like isoform X2 [Mizuhopecten yessoensis]|uniref:anoctamin-4-like isoform X2 n=1 Tax=Mizuhopecten yessoensis TaxID=6573 RepID=UPI000B45E679|nr:anoctamin-4-like isoform X2 [Mizuhopecten yessoensis]